MRNPCSSTEPRPMAWSFDACRSGQRPGPSMPAAMASSSTTNTSSERTASSDAHTTRGTSSPPSGLSSSPHGLHSFRYRGHPRPPLHGGSNDRQHRLWPSDRPLERWRPPRHHILHGHQHSIELRPSHHGGDPSFTIGMRAARWGVPLFYNSSGPSTSAPAEASATASPVPTLPPSVAGTSSTNAPSPARLFGRVAATNRRLGICHGTWSLGALVLSSSNGDLGIGCNKFFKNLFALTAS
jgi:hypothetical protein